MAMLCAAQHGPSFHYLMKFYTQQHHSHIVRLSSITASREHEEVDNQLLSPPGTERLRVSSGKAPLSLSSLGSWIKSLCFLLMCVFNVVLELALQSVCLLRNSNLQIYLYPSLYTNCGAFKFQAWTTAQGCTCNIINSYFFVNAVATLGDSVMSDWQFRN